MTGRMGGSPPVDLRSPNHLCRGEALPTKRHRVGRTHGARCPGGAADVWVRNRAPDQPVELLPLLGRRPRDPNCVRTSHDFGGDEGKAFERSHPKEVEDEGGVAQALECIRKRGFDQEEPVSAGYDTRGRRGQNLRFRQARMKPREDDECVRPSLGRAGGSPRWHPRHPPPPGPRACSTRTPEAEISKAYGI